VGTRINELLARILGADGGVARWNGYEKVDATLGSGGGLLALTAMPHDSNLRRMTVWLREERLPSMVLLLVTFVWLVFSGAGGVSVDTSSRARWDSR
jgi:hypothetical protein